MMQQMTVAGWQPLTPGMLGRGARWGALAVASIAVPATLVLAALTQAVAPASTPALLVAPTAIEAPSIAPAGEPATSSEQPSTPLNGGGIPANPAYDLSAVDLYFDPECACLGWY